MESDSKRTSTKSKPTLIFLETTVACDYRCRHCRASTQSDPSPDEMTVDQVIHAIDGIKQFGKPYPTVIFTGGNLLMKDGIREIIKHTHDLDIPFSLSPSGSSLMTPDFLNFAVENSVKSFSLSIDGSEGKTHDWLRRNPGSLSLTISLLREIHAMGIPVQINTTVMKKNVKDLPFIAKLLKDLGVKIWEVFFLIKTGRGLYEKDLNPEEMEDVNLWLSTLEDHGITVRPVESPIFRRIRQQKTDGVELKGGALYEKLMSTTQEIFGNSHHKPKEPLKKGPRPEFGLVFIAQNGDVYPNGFLPISRGNVKSENLAEIYWNDEMIHNIYSRNFLKGRCGECEYKHVCGGSRSRAYSTYKDPFAEDPACIYQPSGSGSFGGR